MKRELEMDLEMSSGENAGKSAERIFHNCEFVLGKDIEKTKLGINRTRKRPGKGIDLRSSKVQPQQ